jgi:hypothetical protein
VSSSQQEDILATQETVEMLRSLLSAAWPLAHTRGAQPPAVVRAIDWILIRIAITELVEQGSNLSDLIAIIEFRQSLICIWHGSAESRGNASSLDAALRRSALMAPTVHFSVDAFGAGTCTAKDF